MVERNYRQIEPQLAARFSLVAWASELVENNHVKRHELNTRIESCMECLRYWRQLVEPYTPLEPSLTPQHHRGIYRGGDPDDVQEARDEIKRDKKGE